MKGKRFHALVNVHIIRNTDVFYAVFRQRELEMRIQLTEDEAKELHKQLVHALIQD